MPCWLRALFVDPHYGVDKRKKSLANIAFGFVNTHKRIQVRGATYPVNERESTESVSAE